MAKNTLCANSCPKADNLSCSVNDSMVIMCGGENNALPEPHIEKKVALEGEGGGLGLEEFGKGEGGLGGGAILDLLTQPTINPQKTRSDDR